MNFNFITVKEKYKMFNELIEKTLFQNTLRGYLFSVLMLAIFIAVIYVLRIIVIKNLEKWAASTETTFGDFIITHIKKTLTPVLFAGSFILSVENLVINPVMSKIIYFAGITVLVGMCLKFFISMIDYMIDSYLKKSDANEARRKNLRWFTIPAKILLTGVALIILFDTFFSFDTVMS
jgi:protein-S-isoprenylcysteine O-methyltransferase Ste14